MSVSFPSSFGMRWSAKAYDVDSGEVLVEHNPDLVLSTASIGKLFLLHTLLADVDAGRYSLDDTVTRRPSEAMRESGLWHLMQVNTLPLYDVGVLIGATSDNAATNTLARFVGLDRVDEHTRELGYEKSRLNDVIRWPIPPGMPRRLSEGNAEELAWFVARLARGEDLSRSSADVFRKWLGGSMDMSLVGAGFDFDGLAHDTFDRGAWLWNKTGALSTVRADVGVLMGTQRRVAYALIANWERPTGIDLERDAPRTVAMQTMKEAGLFMGTYIGWACADGDTHG